MEYCEFATEKINPERLKNNSMLASLHQNRITPFANSLSLFIVVRELFDQIGIPQDLLGIISLLIHSFEYQVTLCCGENFSLLLTNDGLIYGWGKNESGQLGTGSTTDYIFSDVMTRTVDIQKEVSTLSCGPLSSYAIMKNGEVYTWGGRERYSQKKGELFPRVVSNLVRISMISCGKNLNLAVNFDGEILSWVNYSPDLILKMNPAKVRFSYDDNEKDSVPCSMVSCGNNHYMAISREGNLYSWGRSQYGQLGHGSFESECYPQLVTGSIYSTKPLLGYVTFVACGLDHTIILTREGKLFAWGSDKYGQLGLDLRMYVSSDPSLRYYTTPQLITTIGFPSSIQIRMIACGDNHTLALSKEGHVYAWGYNYFGQLGLGKRPDSEENNKINNNNNNNCNGNYNNNFFSNHYIYYDRQSRYREREDRVIPACVYLPQKIEGLENISIISCGSNFSSAITRDGIVYVWGRAQTVRGYSSNYFTNFTYPRRKVM